MTVVELFAYPKPSQRHWYCYDLLLDGEPLVVGSRDPEHDLARALLARGLRGVAEVVDGNTGKPRSTVNIERAAKVRVSEEDRDGLRCRDYAENPDSRFWTAETCPLDTGIARAVIGKAA